MNPLFAQFLRSGQTPFQDLEPRRVFNRTGAATVIGRIYKLDTGLTVAAETVVNSKNDLLPAVTTLNWEPMNDMTRQSTSGWNNMILVPNSTTDLSNGLFVIAQEAVGDNESCLVLECGIVNILVDGATATWPPFTHIVPLINESTKVGLATTNSAVKRVGYTLASQAITSGTPVSVSCFFCGWGVL